MEQWTFTESLEEAAAFGTLGMPIRVMRTFCARRERERCKFGLGLINLEGTEKTKKLQRQIRNGDLLARDPAHPYLTIQRAFNNREKLLAYLHRGIGIALHPEDRAPHLHTYRHTPGEATLPGIKKGDILIRTGDIKLAAALGVIGCRLLAIEGSHGQHKFSIDPRGCTLPGHGPIDAPALMHAWRNDPESIPWAHPFAQAMRGLYNRERMLDAVRRANLRVTILAKDGHLTGQSAVVTADARGNISDKAMDKVQDFFGS